jgi:hypothetical protein
MKKPLLNEEILRMRNIMGLNEDFDMNNHEEPEQPEEEDFENVFYKTLNGHEIQSLEFEGVVYVDGRNKCIVVDGSRIKPNDNQLRDLWDEYIESEGLYEGEPGEKMVSFDDLLAQDTDGISPEDQAMIDAHDEEEANKYASKNYDDVEAGITEDWGSSDQSYMNKSIHDDLNQPTEFNFGMLDDLRNAAEVAVDHHWSDWEEYNTDRDALVMQAMKRYLRRYFPEWYENI